MASVRTGDFRVQISENMLNIPPGLFALNHEVTIYCPCCDDYGFSDYYELDKHIRDNHMVAAQAKNL